MNAQPNLKIETWPIGKVINYARNARLHSDGQVSQIAASIKEFGFINPCLVDPDGTLIAGHGRVMACKRLGMPTVPVIKIGHLTENQIKALRIADNQLPTLASWSPDLLRIELNDLQLSGYDMPLLGFDNVQLVQLMADAGSPGLTDPDDAPEPPANPVAIRGDLWALGRHRLLCGDATSSDDTQNVLGGVEPHLMVTDPPYGVEYDANWRNEADRANGKPYGARAVGKVENDDRSDWSAAYALFPGEVAYVWHPADATGLVFGATLQASGFEIRMVIIWAKQHFPIGRGHYHVQHEPCYYAVRKKSGATGHWSGDRKQTTLWQIPKPQKSETGHSTQKPVECMKRPIENNSSPGQAVYEPFSGSGTTIIAGEMTGRCVYAIELNPAYIDVAIQRWQNFTGQQATLDGKTFAQISDERLNAKPKPKPKRKAKTA